MVLRALQVPKTIQPPHKEFIINDDPSGAESNEKPRRSIEGAHDQKSYHRSNCNESMTYQRQWHPKENWDFPLNLHFFTERLNAADPKYEGSQAFLVVFSYQFQSPSGVHRRFGSLPSTFKNISLSMVP